MRRSKIKPSINLASRRSVVGAPQAGNKATLGTPSTNKPAAGTSLGANPARGTSSTEKAAAGKSSAAKPAPGNLSPSNSAPGNLSASNSAPRSLPAANSAPGTHLVAKPTPEVEGPPNGASHSSVSMSPVVAPESNDTVGHEAQMKGRETVMSDGEVQDILGSNTDLPGNPTEHTSQIQEQKEMMHIENATLSEAEQREHVSTAREPISSEKPQEEEASSNLPPSSSVDDKVKNSTAASKRRRFSAVPNLGQQRSKSSVPKNTRPRAENIAPVAIEVKVQGQNEDSFENRAEQNETREQEASPTPTGPPPVQRVLVAPISTNKLSTEEASASGIQKQVDVSSKTIKEATVFKTPLAPVPVPPAKPDANVGEGRTSEVDGKRTSSSLVQSRQANVYSKKLKELKDQIYEETPSKRRKSHPRSTSPDRSKMTMGDLIYYNPKSNPMRVTQAEKMNKKGKKTPQRSNGNKKNLTKENDKASGNENEPVDSMAPQVKIGDNGEIIIDQSSLVVEASPARTFDPSDSEVVHEDSSNTTYSSFRERKRTAVWKKKDTDRFFKALSCVGTDFTMINALFPSRTRAEIKRKFKKEEKINRLNIDKALSERKEFDMSMFDLSEDETEENEEDVPKKSKKTQKEKDKAQSLENDQNLEETAENVDDRSETDDDVRSMASVNDDTHDSQDDLEEQPNLTSILGTTRSGRKPKLRTSFTIEIPPKQTRKRTRASPAEGTSKIKVFDSYAVNRLQELQRQHEAALAKKRAEKDASEDESDTVSMISEVGSVMSEPDGDIAGVATPGLQTNFMTHSTTPVNPGSRTFSSPHVTPNDPSVKKVMLMITTPDGKKTLVHVNLTPSQDLSNVPSTSGNSPAVISGQSVLGAGNRPGVSTTTPLRTNVVLDSNLVQTPTQPRCSKTPSRGSLVRIDSPVGRLTTLTNVSSPYAKGSPRNIIQTAQPSKQSKNVTSAKIVDGKIVFCSPESRSSPAVRFKDNLNLNVKQGIAPHVSSVNQLSPHRSSVIQTSQHVNGNTTLITQSRPSPRLDQITSPSPEACITNHQELAAHFIPPITSPNEERTMIDTTSLAQPTLPTNSIAMDLPEGPLPDLGANLSMSSNLDVISYGESAILMGDPIIAQQVDVASTDSDGSVTVPNKKRKHNPQEAFIPNIR